MKRLSWASAVLFIGAFLLCVLCACSQEETPDYYGLGSGGRVHAQDTLTFAASLHNTPFEDKTAYEPAGFTVDLCKAIAEEMGLGCEFTKSKYLDALPAAVQADGDADVIASSLLLSDSGSDDTLCYSDSYIDFCLALSANKHDDYTSINDLAGKRIGVQADSDSSAYVEQLIAQWEAQNVYGTQICTYDSVEDAMSDLQAQNVDGVVAEAPALQYFTRVMYYQEEIVQEFPDVTQGYVFAVASDNENLMDDINAALASLKESGKYQEIYDSWFNYDEEASNPEDATVPPQDQQGYVKGAW